MGKTYRRQTGDKFERRQRKRQKNPKRLNMDFNSDEKDFTKYEKDDYNSYK